MNEWMNDAWDGRPTRNSWIRLLIGDLFFYPFATCFPWAHRVILYNVKHLTLPVCTELIWMMSWFPNWSPASASLPILIEWIRASALQYTLAQEFYMYSPVFGFFWSQSSTTRFACLEDWGDETVFFWRFVLLTVTYTSFAYHGFRMRASVIGHCK